METNRQEQLEAIETMREFNQRIMKNIKILVKELSGKRLDDTEVFQRDIIKALNWVLEVVNLTADVLNEKETYIVKEDTNKAVTALNEAINAKDDAKMAAAFEGLLPMLEKIDEAAASVLI